MSSFHGVVIELFHCIQRVYCIQMSSFQGVGNIGVPLFTERCWNRGFHCIQMSSFQGVGIEGSTIIMMSYLNNIYNIRLHIFGLSQNH